MADRQRFSATQVIEALKQARGIKIKAAEILGCHRHTIDSYCNRYPTVQAAYDEQSDVMVDVAESALRQKLDEQFWPAIRFVLMTKGKTRDYVERKEVAGTPGQPLEVKIEDASDDERIAAIVAALDAARERENREPAE